MGNYTGAVYFLPPVVELNLNLWSGNPKQELHRYFVFREPPKYTNTSQVPGLLGHLTAVRDVPRADAVRVAIS